jgi:NAD-dependent dihydropyrimidine dehydrogenase PreA subunit
VPYVILSDECIACGTCRQECPSEAIVEKGDAYAITEACIECAACFEACPSGAVVDN